MVYLAFLRIPVECLFQLRAWTTGYTHVSSFYLSQKFISIHLLKLAPTDNWSRWKIEMHCADHILFSFHYQNILIQRASAGKGSCELI